MSQKQQALMNMLNKSTRQYFLYEECPRKPIKMKVRNTKHLIEVVTSKEPRHEQLKQRLLDNEMGQLTPQFTSYKPVSGWPVLRLEELVLKVMEKQLDPKIYAVLKAYFEKTEVKRSAERTDLDEAIKDLSVVFKFRTCGFNRIKAHLAETDARMHNVNAGYDFQQHLTRTCQARRQRETSQEEGIRKYSADPNVVVAKERVRRDTLKFILSVKDILEMILLVRLRHLRSHTPINLQLLGTERDRLNTKQAERGLQYPGGPPVAFSFREQIISEAPPGWPLSSKFKSIRRPKSESYAPSYPSNTIRITNKSLSNVPTDGTSKFIKRCRTPEEATAVLDCRESDSEFLSEERERDMCRIVFSDVDMHENFRKRWPPVWMSLAAAEQGFFIVDPQCPTRECALKDNMSMLRRKSMTDVLARRENWAQMREDLDTSVKETLWREDMERLDFFRVQYASLSEIPLAKPYDTHHRHVNSMLGNTRLIRQQTTIFDCELSKWYKYLVIKVKEEVGDRDEEINQLLENIKVHFKMSPTSPPFAKAKLALIAMSLPADMVTSVYVQRALRFVLCNVLQCPESMLVGWLAIRGLPFVLLSSHAL